MLTGDTQFVSAIKTVNTLRSLPLILAGLLGVGVAFYFWNSTDLLMNFVSFVLFQVMGTVLLVVFAENPIAWLTYVGQMAATITIGLLRWILIAFKFVLLGILYLIYLISPIDLIPGDVFTVVGLLDDIILGFLYASWVMSAQIERPEMDFSFDRNDLKLRWIASAGVTFASLLAIKLL
jgi:hypothetical protein